MNWLTRSVHGQNYTADKEMVKNMAGELTSSEEKKIPDEAEITIKDIARICGVGVSTVSRAINNHPDINPVTKQAIMDTIEKYGYIPNNSARNLKRTDAKCIAVLIKGLTNPFFAGMLSIIEDEVEKKRYSLVLRHVEYSQDEVDVALELIKEKRLRGIVFLGGHFAHSEDKLAKLTVPFVIATAGCVPKNISRTLYSSLTVDDEKEGYKMTKYLLDQGHRKIAILTADEADASISHLRLLGYCRAMEEYGLKVDEGLVCTMKEGIEWYTMQNGYAVTRELLDRRDDVTAIFAISDVMAVGVCRAIRDKGKRVPEDIAVAGYDGMDIGIYSVPSITTIKQPVDEIARESILLLFDIISKKKEHQHKVFDAQLIERESTMK